MAVMVLPLSVCGLVHAEGPRFYQHLLAKHPSAVANFVMTEGFRVRDYPAYDLKPPVDWAANPHGDSNWRFQLNAMYPLAAVFQQLEVAYDPKLHDFARCLFLSWIRFNIEEDRDHPFRWNDMATGIRAAYLAQLIYYEQTAVPTGANSALDRLVHAGIRHLEVLGDPQRLALNNHGLFQLVGIAALCEVHDFYACERAVDYANENYEGLFWRQFNEEGMHLEHSPEYHLLALNVVTKIAETGLLELGERARRVVRLAMDNLNYLIHPDGGFAELGDTQARFSSGAVAHDARARWLVTGGESGQEPDYGVRVFPETGYAVVRLRDSLDRDSYLMLSAAHHSRVHKHLDSGTFEWSDRDRRVIVDSGKWGYDDGPERDYVLGPSAHNVVETIGVEISPGDWPQQRPELSAGLSNGIAIIRLRLELPRRLRDAVVYRLLVLNPGEWLVVADEIREFWPREQVQWFQLAIDAELATPTVANEFYFSRTAGRLSVRPLVEVNDRVLYKGRREGGLQGWNSPDYGVLEPSWQMGFLSGGWTTQFVTLFRWVDAEDHAVNESDWRSAAAIDFSGAGDEQRFCWQENAGRVGVRLAIVDGHWVASGCG